MAISFFNKIMPFRVKSNDIQPQRQVQDNQYVTKPMPYDSFELRTKQTTDSLNEYNLIKNKNYLELFACKKYDINIEDFHSLDELHNYFEEKLQEFEKFNFEKVEFTPDTTIEQREAEWERLDKLESIQKSLSQISSEEFDTVKKFIYCNEYFNSAKRHENILPYDKETADNIFQEIETKVQRSPRKKHKDDFMRAYKKQLLNSDKLQLSLDYDESFGQININNQYGNKVGQGVISLNKDGVAYCCNLMVNEEYRHSQTSKRALNMIYAKREELARENNSTKMMLDVHTTNSRAARGYITQQNFKIVDFDINKYTQKMEKQLCDGNISQEEADQREKGTELFYEFCCFDRSKQERLIEASKCINDSKLNAEEKDFLIRYFDYRLRQKPLH